MEEAKPKKKRKSVYNPEAAKKWVEKNREKKARADNKSKARRFILDVMTLEEVDEFKSYIAEREKQLKGAV